MTILPEFLDADRTHVRFGFSGEAKRAARIAVMAEYYESLRTLGAGNAQSTIHLPLTPLGRDGLIDALHLWLAVVGRDIAESDEQSAAAPEGSKAQ